MTTPLDEVGLWEDAYLRFETPQEEIRKFRRRLTKLGIAKWPRDAAAVELFCGRGNGLKALAELGFQRLEGIDLSPRLVAQYTGSGRCYVGDCTQLPFAERTKDLLIVQGGLHHLTTLPDDLDKVLSEARRVLRQDGRFVAVEPWLTPFLRVVHASCNLALCRRLSEKVDALATMIRYERTTYEGWLNAPDLIMNAFRRHFEPKYVSVGWGKLSFVGSPRPGRVQT
jgi:SAM-dependent methyltransferase